MIKWIAKIEQGKLLDMLIFLIALLLAIVGVISVYSAGSYFATLVKDNPFYYVQRQAIFVIVSIVLCVIIMRVKYKYFLDSKMLQRAFFVIMLLLIIALFMPETKGARAWIPLGAFSLQPAEFAKIFLIWATAYYFAQARQMPALEVPDNATKSMVLWGKYHPEIMIFVVYVCIIVSILIQPDTGGAAIIIGTLLLLWAASGVITYKQAVKYIGIGMAALITTIFLIATIGPKNDYRIRRILTFLDPFSAPADDSWQIRNSFIALSRGGLTGVGIGNSVQKTGYLPEFHTDYILSIIGEELGLVGICFVLGLLFLLIYLIFKRSLTVSGTFNQLLLRGIAIMFIVQAILNIAGTTSLLPLTGVTLPFISYGGSSMMTSFICIGIVLKISLYDRKNK